MAHVFDHGLSKPLRTLVRDGVIAALRPLLLAEGGYLRAVEPYGATLRTDDETTMALVHEALNGRAPAVLVSLAGKTSEEFGSLGRRWCGVITVQVILYSNSARSMVARLAGDAASDARDQAEPGLDVMLEHIEELLIDNNLGIGSKAQTLQPISEEEIAADHGDTIWLQTYQIRVSRDVLDHRTAPLRIASFLTSWRAAAAPTATPEPPGSELTTVTP